MGWYLMNNFKFFLLNWFLMIVNVLILIFCSGERFVIGVDEMFRCLMWLKFESGLRFDILYWVSYSVLRFLSIVMWVRLFM